MDKRTFNALILQPQMQAHSHVQLPTYKTFAKPASAERPLRVCQGSLLAALCPVSVPKVGSIQWAHDARLVNNLTFLPLWAKVAFHRAPITIIVHRLENAAGCVHHSQSRRRLQRENSVGFAAYHWCPHQIVPGIVEIVATRTLGHWHP